MVRSRGVNGGCRVVVSAEEQEQRIVERLVALDRTVGTAESCSGGLVAHRLTRAPGASKCLLGGIVAYSNDVKARLVGVPEGEIEEHGAVSEPVARSMAEGIRRVLDVDFGIGVTGIAGPSGGSPDKPVGLVYVALSDERGASVERCEFSGNRTAVQEQTAEKALAMLWERVSG
ncbi:MAG: CinA family protein [bacterium]|nr:CinA family protein [bacterium]